MGFNWNLLHNLFHFDSFPDEAEMVEEYDVSSGELLGQKIRNKLVLLAFTGLLGLNYCVMTFLNICIFINKLQNR